MEMAVWNGQVTWNTFEYILICSEHLGPTRTSCLLALKLKL